MGHGYYQCLPNQHWIARGKYRIQWISVAFESLCATGIACKCAENARVLRHYVIQLSSVLFGGRFEFIRGCRQSLRGRKLTPRTCNGELYIKG